MNARLAALMARIKSRQPLSTLVILLTLTIGILIGTVLSHTGVKGSSRKTADATLLPVQSPQQLSSTFGQVIKQIGPTVVNIRTETNGKARRRPGRPNNRGEGQDPFQDFFDRYFGQNPDDDQNPFDGQGNGRQRSLGSGVVLNANGYIITNFHVVDGADRIRVRIKDDPPGMLHDAKVIGSDRETDLAVIKIDPPKEGTFQAARLGDSDKMSVGDWVVAVGSPFDLENTVTAGIVSAIGRNINPGRQFQSFIQTDAAINPGNSGGPLVNMQGEVVGINTAIVAGGAGIGFAIPSNMAKKIYTELQAKGRVTRGWLGVSIQPLTPELAKSFGVKDTKGVLVSEVMPDSPAAKSGLKQGDILIEFEGKKVDAPADLQRAVGLSNPGQSAKLKLWRGQDGKAPEEKTLEVKIGEAPDEREAQQRSGGGGSGSRSGMLGMDVEPITPEIARQLNLRSTEGVVVRRVEDGGTAADAGIQRGDVIREINRQRVRSQADYDRMTKDVKEGDRITMLLQRGQFSQYVAFTVGRG